MDEKTNEEKENEKLNSLLECIWYSDFNDDYKQVLEDFLKELFAKK